MLSKLRKFILSLVLFIVLSGQTASIASPNPMIHQSGKVVVDGQGQPIRLNGVNLEGWIQWEGLFFGASMLTSGFEVRKRISQLVGSDSEELFEQAIHENFVTEEDFAKISQLGFNSVRLPITAHLLEDPDHPGIYKQSGWQLIDQALGWCEKYHVYAIIDLHSAPGRQSKLPTCERATDKTELLWDSEDSKQRTVNLWHAIAQRYSNRGVVAGYDLLNEPSTNDGGALVQLYQRIISAIRTVDEHHMVMLEGGKLATDFSMFRQPLCDNQLYSLHMYNFFGDDREKRLRSYKQLSDSQNVPLWVGEFGANNYKMIDSTVAMFSSLPEVGGWCYWTWKRPPSIYPNLTTIRVPGTWKRVAKWISFPVRLKPSPSTTAEAINDFVNATKLSNTPLDSRMVQILTARR